MRWEDILRKEQEKPYFKAIHQSIEEDENNHITIYPPKELRLSALNKTPLETVKVVILGQDPYHGENEAHGLSFSVQKGIKIPPSLRNIFKELQHDIGGEIPLHGDLSHWAEQGVLLLNTALSVQHKKPGSHSHIGWEKFTDKIIESVSTLQPYVVFILWGKHAQTKLPLISERHGIIQTPHPSPFSAHRGFLGSKPFSKTNRLLGEQGIDGIAWI